MRRCSASERHKSAVCLASGDAQALPTRVFSSKFQSRCRTSHRCTPKKYRNTSGSSAAGSNASELSPTLECDGVMGNGKGLESCWSATRPRRAYLLRTVSNRRRTIARIHRSTRSSISHLERRDRKKEDVQSSHPAERRIAYLVQMRRAKTSEVMTRPATRAETRACCREIGWSKLGTTPGRGGITPGPG